MKMKEETEKAGLKLNIQKIKIMASSPGGENVETVSDFILLGSKITVDSDGSHKIKTLALWKNSYDKPRQCIKKQRHHFVDKSLSTIVKAMVFLVVMYGYESWAIKKAEH